MPIPKPGEHWTWRDKNHLETVEILGNSRRDNSDPGDEPVIAPKIFVGGLVRVRVLSTNQVFQVPISRLFSH